MLGEDDDVDYPKGSSTPKWMGDHAGLRLPLGRYRDNHFVLESVEFSQLIGSSAALT